LTQQPLTLGRQPDNTLVLADPEVSGHHAIISWQSEANLYILQDLNSTNGTYVNERRVEEPQLLRQGDMIRMGNTVMSVQLGAISASTRKEESGVRGQPDDSEDEFSANNLVLPGVIIVLLAGITFACLFLVAILLLGGGKAGPSVTIQSPADGAQVVVGNEIILQATASGASDITLIELSVDDNPVASSSSAQPDGASSLSVSKPWVFDVPGEYAVSAVARTAQGKVSKTESVAVTVVAVGGQPSATPTITPTETTATPEPTVTFTPTPEPGAPQIEYFRAVPQSIVAGQCTKLEWGRVTGASSAQVDPDIGGVGTPGDSTVCPTETTTYILTARGPGGTTTASTTISVSSALADLIIDAISFEPNPAVEGQDTQVRITIRNAGSGAAGDFDWDWQAGSDAYFDGRLRGLKAGETTVVTVRWNPSRAYASLTTLARVDINNEVPESNEDNNQLTAVVRVVEGAGGSGSVTLTSQARLDGYQANDGSGSNRQDILIGNGALTGSAGELVWRGFMSFDLSDIPGGASIESAELRFYQAKVGGDPYGKLGSLVLDHVDYGDSLDANDFGTPAIDSAVLGQQRESGAWYVLADRTIVDWLEKDLSAGRPRFQARMRFGQETDGDGNEDFSGIESANNFFGTGNAPQLIVTYGK
jgi:pSer/pThr/pTyr-binding forkhead associated (FHA) protein